MNPDTVLTAAPEWVRQAVQRAQVMVEEHRLSLLAGRDDLVELWRVLKQKRGSRRG